MLGSFQTCKVTTWFTESKQQCWFWELEPGLNKTWRSPLKGGKTRTCVPGSLSFVTLFLFRYSRMNLMFKSSRILSELCAFSALSAHLYVFFNQLFPDKQNCRLGSLASPLNLRGGPNVAC